MGTRDLLYPLVVLAFIQLSVVVTTVDGGNDFVDRSSYGDRKDLKRKMAGRYNYKTHISTLMNDETSRDRLSVDGKKDTVDRSPHKDLPQGSVIPKGTPTPPTITAKGGEEGKVNNTHNGGNSGTGSGSGVFPAINQMDIHTVFYILIGISSIIIGYFVFRIIRSKSRRKTKKYGVLATRGSEVELTPLEQDDEDEDMTVFDANSR